MANEVEHLAAIMADHLDENADQVVERWIDTLQRKVDTRAVSGLPRAAIRNHIPPVLRSIASYLRSPIHAVRSEMLGHLELHARLRRAQGYELRELLTEFDLLAHRVSEELRKRLYSLEQSSSAAAVIEAFERVATGLRAIGFVTVDLFRESEIDERRRLANHLEEFSRTIAHELRTPLQTASLGLELLRKEMDSEDRERREHHICVIQASLARTADLVDNLRQLAMVEGGLSHGDNFDRVQKLVQETFEQAGPLAHDRHVELLLEGEIPDVAVDRMAFQLALVNVLGNAIKYSDPEKERRWVKVSTRVEEVEGDLDRLVVTVEDNGLGVPDEYLRRVFQRHIRAHPEAAEGTGLGLAITRQLISERGGSIRLESEVGEGTTVSFELPSHPGQVTNAPTVEPRHHTLAQAVRSLRSHDDDDDGASGGE